MARRSISLGLAALVFAVVTVASVDPAAACSCAGSTDSEAVAAADVVFSGELVEIRTPPGASYSSADPERFVFAVDHVYKGDAMARQSVVTPREGASCGLELSGSGPFLVFATTERTLDLEGDEGELYSHLCSGTRALAASAVPASFGSGAPPTDGSSAIGSFDDGGPGVVPVVAGVSAVAALALAVGYLVARRRGSASATP